MDKTTYNLKVRFITGPLGTQPQREVAEEFLVARAIEGGAAIVTPNGVQLPEDEVATIDQNVERGTTAFHKFQGKPVYFDYQIKGFLKDAGLAFNGLSNVKNLRSKIDNYVFIEPRMIFLNFEGSIQYCDRPLRAMTAQGPRVSLARSEELPPDTWFECQIKTYDNGPITENILRQLLSYGEDKGMGQWRNGGRGRFTFELTKVA